MTTKPRPIWLAGLAVLSAALGACGGSSQGSALDPFLCAAEDLGWPAHEVMRGEFGRNEFPEDRAAGFQRGRFVFFSEVLQRPPFQPPMQVLCQVIEFDSSDSARRWVASVSADALFMSPEVALVPDDERQVHEFPDLGFPATGTASRLLQVTAGSGPSAVAAEITIASLGRLAIVQFVGENESRVTQRAAEALGSLSEAFALRIKDEEVPR